MKQNLETWKNKNMKLKDHKAENVDENLKFWKRSCGILHNDKNFHSFELNIYIYIV